VHAAEPDTEASVSPARFELSHVPARRLIAIGIFYFGAAELGFLIGSGHGTVCAVSLPSGLALAVILLCGVRVWPAILVPSFLANLHALWGHPAAHFGSLLGATAGISIGNTVQALVAAWLAKKFAQGRDAFDHPRSIFLYLGWAAALTSLIGVTTRVLCYTTGGFVTWANAPASVLTWWLASLCSVLVVTPMILVWSRRPVPAISIGRLGEFGILLLLLVFACNVIFRNPIVRQTNGTLTFLIIPLLLWAALRFGRRGTATAILLFSTLSIYATLAGFGPFAVANHTLSLLLLQGFIATVSLVAFLVQADALERREAVSALLISEQRYRELFESNPQSMWAYDEETQQFLAVNNAALENYGYSRSEFLKLRVPQLTASQRRGTEKSAGGFLVETLHRKSDGNLIDVESSQRSIILQGRRASLVLSTDVTEKKRAEQQAAAFSTLGSRLSAARTPKEAARIMASAASEIFRWDACFFDLLVDQAQQLTTVMCMDTVNGERKEVVPEPIRGLNATAREAIQQPKLVLRSAAECAFAQDAVPFGDKTRPSASLMFVPIKKDEKVIGLLSLQSYTPNAYTEKDLETFKALADHCAGALERIRAESENEALNAELRHRVEELRLLNEDLEHRVKERTSQLEAINKELEAFSYSVSHDLRAPLRSIRGFTEVLLERHQAQLDARGLEFLRRVCQSAQHMDKLIEDLLKLSRVGRAEIQSHEIDLGAMAETILKELAAHEPERKVDIQLQPGLKAFGDERLVKVAMENLLQNAWKFTAKTQTPRIEVGQTHNGERAFFVRDNGAGFDMSYANRLFGVFQRLHTTSEFPGTGVGLATTQRIINRHGGHVWAEAKPDAGATFYFTLPQHEHS